MRPIDADVLIETMVERKRPEDGADWSKERYRYIQWLADYWAVKDAPTIKTKQVKYYDEDENVWKVGEVIERKESE